MQWNVAPCDPQLNNAHCADMKSRGKKYSNKNVKDVIGMFNS